MLRNDTLTLWCLNDIPAVRTEAMYLIGEVARDFVTAKERQHGLTYRPETADLFALEVAWTATVVQIVRRFGKENLDFRNRGFTDGVLDWMIAASRGRPCGLWCDSVLFLDVSELLHHRFTMPTLAQQAEEYRVSRNRAVQEHIRDMARLGLINEPLAFPDETQALRRIGDIMGRSRATRRLRGKYRFQGGADEFDINALYGVWEGLEDYLRKAPAARTAGYLGGGFRAYLTAALERSGLVDAVRSQNLEFTKEWKALLERHPEAGRGTLAARDLLEECMEDFFWVAPRALQPEAQTKVRRHQSLDAEHEDGDGEPWSLKDTLEDERSLHPDGTYTCENGDDWMANRRLMIEAIRAADLSDRERLCLELKLDEKSDRQIARALEAKHGKPVNEATVRKHMSNARRKVKEAADQVQKIHKTGESADKHSRGKTKRGGQR